jgi:hypothetical protein
MTAWTIWREEPPPRDAWVQAKYRFGGCCVYGIAGSMVLPAFWLPATPEQIAAEEAAVANLRPVRLRNLQPTTPKEPPDAR